MKSTGIVRKIDHLGRIMIPIELRRALEITNRNSVEIFLEDKHVILQKYKIEKVCIVTGEILDEDFESEYIKGMPLSSKGAAILLKELQNITKK